MARGIVLAVRIRFTTRMPSLGRRARSDGVDELANVGLSGAQVLSERSVFDVLPRAIVVTDAAGQIVLWNRRAESLYGWAESEVLGRSAVEVLVPTEAHDDANTIRALLAAGESWQGDFTVMHRDGRRVRIFVVDTPLLDGAGRVVGMVGASEDVTALRRLERQAQDLRDRLDFAREAAGLGTWTWDMASGSTTWDIRLEEMHGLRPGGFGGTFEDWLAALYPEDRAECLATVEKALANPGPYALLHRTVWPDGSVHHIECRGLVLVDDAGTPTGTTGVAIDVTDRERNRKALIQAFAGQSEVIETLQRALLPPVLPHVEGISLSVRYISAQRYIAIGGDWYAVLPFPDGRLGLAIGDVAGHGLAAVADMAAARFSLRALALAEEAPDRTLERLNDVVRVFESDTMITALYGILDPKARTWTYASAGHCPAVVRHPDGTTVLLDDRCDPPLGYAASFRQHTAELSPGSTLVLYTDGLIERRTEPITTGLDRLIAACNAGPSDPEALCAHLTVEMFRDVTINDDVAIVVAKLQ